MTKSGRATHTSPKDMGDLRNTVHRCSGVALRRARVTLTLTLTLAACSSSNFAGNSGKTRAPEKPSSSPAQDAKKAVPKGTSTTPDAGQGSSPDLPDACRQEYQVPASANLWLAGVAAGTRIVYRVPTGNFQTYTTIDQAPEQNPVLVATATQGCLTPGQALAFTVSGQISHGSDTPTDADGTKGEVVAHLNAGAYGKSDVRAPINSLLGVFLGADDPSTLPAPAGLDFTGDDARNLSLLQPAIGQVFFIGTGKTASGQLRKVVVPTGTERLYFGIMDAFEWHNNTGSLSGAIQSSANVSH